MKASNQILLCALLLFSGQNGFAAEDVISEMKETSLLETPNRVVFLLPATELKKVIFDEDEAWKQLCLAKNSKATDVRHIYRLAEVARERLRYVYTGNC